MTFLWGKEWESVGTPEKRRRKGKRGDLVEKQKMGPVRGKEIANQTSTYAKTKAGDFRGFKKYHQNRYFFGEGNKNQSNRKEKTSQPDVRSEGGNYSQ